jgi:hypothetical protein
VALPAATETNKASMRRFVDEALTRGVLDVETRPAASSPSRRRPVPVLFVAHFSDAHTTIGTLIAADGWVAFHLRHQSTHEGLGIAATGMRVDSQTMGFTRFSTGVVAET